MCQSWKTCPTSQRHLIARMVKYSRSVSWNWTVGQYWSLSSFCDRTSIVPLESNFHVRRVRQRVTRVQSSNSDDNLHKLEERHGLTSVSRGVVNISKNTRRFLKFFEGHPNFFKEKTIGFQRLLLNITEIFWKMFWRFLWNLQQMETYKEHMILMLRGWLKCWRKK